MPTPKRKVSKPRQPEATDGKDAPDPEKLSAVYDVVERIVESVLDRRAAEDFRQAQDDELDARINGNTLDGVPRVAGITGVSMIRLGDGDELVAKLRAIAAKHGAGEIRGSIGEPDDFDPDDDEYIDDHDPETCPGCRAAWMAEMASTRAFGLRFLGEVTNIVRPFVRNVQDKDDAESWQVMGSHESIEGELGEFLRATLRAGTAVAGAVADTVGGDVKGVK